MRIKPIKRRKSFRARYNCDNPDQKQKHVIGHVGSGNII